MKNKLANIFIFLLLGNQFIYSQNFAKEFGKATQLNFEDKQYAAYQNAEAVVIFDLGKSYFVRDQNSYDVVYERTTRIKILSDAGAKWAEIEIPYYHEGSVWEKVTKIEAYSYNYDNGLKINKLETSNVYEEKINDKWSVKKFVVPQVKAGSVVDYRYSIISEYKFNLRDWEFQWRIPVQYSEYEVQMISFYEYTWLLQGTNKFTEQSSYVDSGLKEQFAGVEFNPNVHKFIIKDVQAFESEELISSINDYIIKLDFQLSRINYPTGGSLEIITTWDNMIKDYLKEEKFGKYINKAEKLSTKLIDIEEFVNKTDREKLDFTIDYLKKNFNWNGINSEFASKSPSDFVKDKHGNSADINLFAVGMLNMLGINAKPVLLSTRGHGKIKYDYPFTHFFNYVILMVPVDGGFVLSDATEVFALNDRIPARCINDKGLIVSKENNGWVGLECLFPSEIKTEISYNLANNDTIFAHITKTATEYDALDFRNKYGSNIEEIRKILESKSIVLEESSIVVENQLDKTKPYVLSFNQILENQVAGDKIYLSPFLNESISNNPLKQKVRTYAIDLTYPKKRTFITTLKIPEGYQVEYVPANQKFNNILFGFDFSTQTDGDQITVKFEHQLKKTVYPPTDFTNIKYFFEEIVKKSGEKIVLSKVKN